MYTSTKNPRYQGKNFFVASTTSHYGSSEDLNISNLFWRRVMAL